MSRAYPLYPQQRWPGASVLLVHHKISFSGTLMSLADVMGMWGMWFTMVSLRQPALPSTQSQHLNWHELAMLWWEVNNHDPQVSTSGFPKSAYLCQLMCSPSTGELPWTLWSIEQHWNREPRRSRSSLRNERLKSDRAVIAVDGDRSCAWPARKHTCT